LNAGTSTISISDDVDHDEIDINFLPEELDHGALDGLEDDDHAQYTLAAGTRAFTGDQSMGGFKVTDLGAPSDSLDATNMDYVDDEIGDLRSTIPYSHSSLPDKGTNTHATIDTFISSKAQASGLASLDAGSKVVQDPTNATSTPTLNKIPIAGTGGVLASGWIPVSGTQAANADTLDGQHYSDFSGKLVTNGNTHDHNGGDGAQVDHGSLAGLSDDDHTQYIKHSLAQAQYDFLVASEAGTFIRQSLEDVEFYVCPTSATQAANADTVDGSHASAFAVAAKGVTNGDSHDHVSGDGAAITESAINLSSNTTNDTSASKHGFCPALSNDGDTYLDGTGAWSEPGGGYLPDTAFDHFAKITVSAGAPVDPDVNDLWIDTS
jgi:hypothetical protein